MIQMCLAAQGFEIHPNGEFFNVYGVKVGDLLEAELCDMSVKTKVKLVMPAECVEIKAEISE